MNLSNRSMYDIGFTGFGHLPLSVFTVYQAASQVNYYLSSYLIIYLSIYINNNTYVELLQIQFIHLPMVVSNHTHNPYTLHSIHPFLPLVVFSNVNTTCIQEGWVYIMYRATDSIDPLKSSVRCLSIYLSRKDGCTSCTAPQTPSTRSSPPCTSSR